MIVIGFELGYVFGLQSGLLRYETAEINRKLWLLGLAILLFDLVLCASTSLSGVSDLTVLASAPTLTVRILEVELMAILPGVVIGILGVVYPGKKQSCSS